MKNYLKLKFRITLLLFLLSSFIFLTAQPGFSVYLDKASACGLSIQSDGLHIKKINDSLVSIRLLEPTAKINIKNNSGGTINLSLKITNISPQKYKIASKEGRKSYSGTRHVVMSAKLPSGKSANFKISPILQNPNSYAFAVLGDSGTLPAVHKGILKRIAKTDAIFAINLGDIVKNGTREEYVKFEKEVSGFPLPYFVAIGNHDINSRGARDRFFEFIGPLDYSFKLGLFNFIILDNANGGISDCQFNRLTDLLKSNKENMVFMHIPAFSPFNKFEDCLMPDKETSEYFMDLMKKYRVNKVFAGHIHGYGCKRRDNVDYIISGCAGSLPYLLPCEGGYPHYILVRVKGGNVKYEVCKVIL